MRSKVSTSSKKYAYELIATDLVARIDKGEWALGSRIPAVEALVSQYPFSYMTVFKALKLLESRGVVEMRRGSGVYVAKAGRQYTVGMLFYDTILRALKTPFNSLILEAGRRWCEKRGVNLEVYITKHGAKEVTSRDFLASLKNRTLDGFIVLGVEQQLRAFFASSLWKEHAIPYVNITGPEGFPCTVTMDFEAELGLAFRYLAAQGIKDVDVVGAEPLLNGHYAEMATQQGLSLLLHSLSGETAAGANPADRYELFGMIMGNRLLSRDKRPEAILVLDDIMAKGVALALFKHGVKVPDDLLFVTQANKGSGVFYPVPAVKVEFDPDAVVEAAGEALWRTLTTGVPCVGNTRILPELRTAEDTTPGYAALASQIPAPYLLPQAATRKSA